jgi:hypothetical protein
MDLMHQCIYLKEPDIEPPESESVAHQRQSGGKKMFIAVLTLFIQEVPPQYN